MKRLLRTLNRFMDLAFLAAIGAAIYFNWHA